jgi:hypothetical protein
MTGRWPAGNAQLAASVKLDLPEPLGNTVLEG